MSPFQPRSDRPCFGLLRRVQRPEPTKARAKGSPLPGIPRMQTTCSRAPSILSTNCLRSPGRAKPLPHFDIPASIKARTAVIRGEVASQNIAAVYPGSDPTLKNEYVVMSAHIDHLGVGKPVNGDAIFNGAMDNAAGVATVLDTAATVKPTKAALQRSILFLIVTGEEKGLLGSKYFAGNPTVPPHSIVADINTDMFLPLYPLKRLTVYGLDELKRPGGTTSKELMKATGWQPHSVCGFLSGTIGKKMDLTVMSAKGKDGERSYSLGSAPHKR